MGIELYSQSSSSLSSPETTFDATTSFESYYMNQMQILANVIDPNNLYAEVARAGGKTEGITGPRIFVWPMICPVNFPSWYIRPTSLS